MLSRLFNIADDGSSQHAARLSLSLRVKSLLLFPFKQSLVQNLEAAIKVLETNKVTPMKEDKGKHLANELLSDRSVDRLCLLKSYYSRHY